MNRGASFVSLVVLCFFPPVSGIAFDSFYRHYYLNQVGH